MSAEFPIPEQNQDSPEVVEPKRFQLSDILDPDREVSPENQELIRREREDLDKTGITLGSTYSEQWESAGFGSGKGEKADRDLLGFLQDGTLIDLGGADGGLGWRAIHNWGVKNFICVDNNPRLYVAEVPSDPSKMVEQQEYPVESGVKVLGAVRADMLDFLSRMKGDLRGVSFMLNGIQGVLPSDYSSALVGELLRVTSAGAIIFGLESMDVLGIFEQAILDQRASESAPRIPFKMRYIFLDIAAVRCFERTE